jgi:hypothetical protein
MNESFCNKSTIGEDSTVDCSSPVRLPTGYRNSWTNGTPPSKEQEELVNQYLDSKGVDYCVELHHFMIEVG